MARSTYHVKCLVALFLLFSSHTSTAASAIRVVNSCVDSAPSLASQEWTTTSMARRGTDYGNGTETWFFEGSSPSTSAEVSMVYGGKVAGPRAFLYVEYLNESPRRLVVEPVNGGSGIALLPGETGMTQWGSWVGEIGAVGGGGGGGNEQLTITSVLKKPQRVHFRKLVVAEMGGNSMTTTTTTTAAAAALSSLLAKPCKEILSSPPPLSPQQQQSRGGGGGQSLPVTMTTTTRAPGGCKTKTTGTGMETSDCCPECKCVCNCNCGGGGC